MGISHTEATLTEKNCSHCKNMILATLHLQIDLFSEIDSTPHALPVSSSKILVRKTNWDRGSQFSGKSEFTLVQVPCASLSPHRAAFSVLCIQSDQRLSTSTSDLVLFGVNDNDLLDDSM